MAVRLVSFPTIDPRLSPLEQQRVWVREAEQARDRLVRQEAAVEEELGRVRLARAQAEDFVRAAREALRRYEEPRKALVREVR